MVLYPPLLPRVQAQPPHVTPLPRNSPASLPLSCPCMGGMLDPKKFWILASGKRDVGDMESSLLGCRELSTPISGAGVSVLEIWGLEDPPGPG